MALPAIGAALKAAKAAKKLKKPKKPKKPRDAAMARKEFEEDLTGGALLAGTTGMAANEIRKQNKALDEKLQAEDKKASGGLARKRRKSDGGLKVGQRKIAKGCGKVMGNRRKKTLYT